MDFVHVSTSWDLEVQTVLPVKQATVEVTALLISAKQLQTPLLMGQMATSIASMGEILGEPLAPAPAQIVTWSTLEFTAKIANIKLMTWQHCSIRLATVKNISILPTT